MGSLIRWLDLGVVGAYLLALTSLGLGFAREQNTSERYFLARRAIPSWAIGMSIMATLVTTVTFLAYPGGLYQSSWPLLLPGAIAAGMVLLAGGLIVPFYRRAVGMSVYEYFGQRFGRLVRVYAGAAYALGHFSVMAFALFLLATTVSNATGWNADRVILIVGILTVMYTVVGGFEAVIWTNVVQGFVLWASVLVMLACLLMTARGGPARLLADAQHKMQEGAWPAGIPLPGLPALVLCGYGFLWFLQKYTADQAMVQRYLSAKSDRGALKGAAVGAALCVAMSALWMLAGTSAWQFSQSSAGHLPRLRALHLPPGAAGIVMAALLGSAMSAMASGLNSLALAGVEDIYRGFRPEASDRTRLGLAKGTVFVCGAGCVAAALGLTHAKSTALSTWLTVCGIGIGGLGGIFVLAFLGRRASRRGVWAGIAASLVFTAWATLTRTGKGTAGLFPWQYPLTGAAAPIVLIVAGYGASLVWPDPKVGKVTGMTLWHWLKWRKTTPIE